MKLQFSLFLLALVLGCSQPVSEEPDAATSAKPDVSSTEDEPKPDRPSVELHVATLNTGRFFDTVCDSNNCDDNSDFERQFSTAEFNFKVSQISGGIETLDADIVTLQEVENQAALDALMEKLPDYSFAEIGEIGGVATLDVAIIARGMTHLETRKHRNNTVLNLDGGREQRFARELLEVHFDYEGNRVVAFSAHFKAKRNDDPAWRLGEARMARTIAEATQAEFPDALVYIGGDLNDEPGSPPLVAMTGSDGLISVTEGKPDDEIWTYGQLSKSAIDHILYVPADRVGHLSEQTRVVRSSGAVGFAGSDHASLATVFQIFTD